MPPADSQRLPALRRLFLVVLCVWFGLLVVAVNALMARWQAASPPGFPFGVFIQNGTTYAQDFSYNLIYFRGVRDHLVAHPYRLEDQEKLLRQILPELGSGLSHAYSPVAFTLAQPLLAVSGQAAFAIYTVLCAIATLLLFRFYLFPRATGLLQLFALAFCAISVLAMTTFSVGQTAPITTVFLGCFWGVLQRRSVRISLAGDAALALLFWALCLKPSLALLPLTLLLGARAWRPLALGLALLVLNWTLVAGFYGGWWTGLADYFHELNHYNNAAFTPFLQRGSETTAQGDSTFFLFNLNRDLLLGSSLLLLILRWTRRLSASEQFQGAIWSFLLFSPYLLPSENWILLLLIVEGTFFQFRNSLFDCAKILLVLGIFDLRVGLTFPTQPDFILKCILVAWILIDLIRSRQTDACRTEMSPLATDL